jgi:excisionase family DNA binding protein
MRKHARKKPAVLSDELQSEMMSAREVAQYLHRRHRSNVYWLVLQKALPGLRLGAGGGLRFRRSEIDQWIAARLGMKKISAPTKPAPARVDEIMTVPTLALYLRCSLTMIYGLLKTKQIPAFKLGSEPSSEWRFFRSDINEWIAKQHNVTNPPLTRRGKSKVS